METNIEFIQERFINQKFKKHFHQNYSIGFITKGSHKLEIGREKILIKNSEIKIINPYEPHFATEDSSWQYINFMPSSCTINTIASEIYQKEMQETIYFTNKINDAIARDKFLRLYSAKKNSLEYQECLIDFVSYLLNNYSSSSFESIDINYPIARSLEYIHEHFLEEIDLETLANISYMSKYHFLRIFKQKTLITPHQYILNLRIEYAYRLIQKDIPLSLIAQTSGFSDQSHFIRVFKQRFGFTPAKLRV